MRTPISDTGAPSFQETFRALHGCNSSNPSILIETILKSGYSDLLRERHTDTVSREDDLIQFANFLPVLYRSRIS